MKQNYKNNLDKYIRIEIFKIISLSIYLSGEIFSTFIPHYRNAIASVFNRNSVSKK